MSHFKVSIELKMPISQDNSTPLDCLLTNFIVIPASTLIVIISFQLFNNGHYLIFQVMYF